MAATTNGLPKSTTAGPFALARATVEDMVEMVDLEYECFPPYIREVAMGVLDHARDLPRIRQQYIDAMRADPADIWVKVTDVATGRIVAGSNWRVYLNGPPEDRPMDTVPAWLEGEARKASEGFIVRSDETRLEFMRGVPFIHLHICFTDEAYRRRGAGSMMLKWGCEVADLLGLAGWIEASEEGNFLYKVHGFRDHSKIEGELGGLEGMNMKREAKPWAIQGGK